MKYLFEVAELCTLWSSKFRKHSNQWSWMTFFILELSWARVGCGTKCFLISFDHTTPHTCHFGGEEHFETLVFPCPSFRKRKPLKAVVQVINVLGKLVKSDVPATHLFFSKAYTCVSQVEIIGWRFSLHFVPWLPLAIFGTLQLCSFLIFGIGRRGETKSILPKMK